ncbi:hypothetical protein Aduo_013165 [Ancylostoma duodenale]
MVVNELTYIYNRQADQLLTILLDSGSQHSYIRKSTACDLGLKLKNPKDITTLTFGGYRHTETSFHLSITLRDRMYEPIALNLWTREFITTVPANSTPFSNESTLPVVDVNEKSDVDVLIGIDYYWDVVDLNRNQQLPSGFVLSYTKFGPVLSGLRTSSSSYVNTATSFKPSAVENEEHKETDEIVRRLFGLESAGLTDDPSESDESVIQQYYSTVKIIDGLIHVKFPWKSNHPFLPDNEGLTLRRLESQYAKLHTDQMGWSDYCQTFDQQLKSRIIEEVDEQQPQGPHVYYIPHQAVIKQDSNTTKLRIVFDASSHRRGSPSLNDCIHQGPTMSPDLCGTLLRSRLNPFLITADVEKAFHQIRLQEDQRDATRFLWSKTV